MKSLELLARLNGLTLEFGDEFQKSDEVELGEAVSVLKALVDALLEGRTAELSKVVNLYFVEDLTPQTTSVRQY
jgi:hypothetical protein